MLNYINFKRICYNLKKLKKNNKNETFFKYGFAMTQNIM